MRSSRVRTSRSSRRPRRSRTTWSSPSTSVRITPPRRDTSLGPFLRRPSEAGLLLDFDGTLSPIAARPELATPADGAAEVLAELARVYALVALISGRRTEDL